MLSNPSQYRSVSCLGAKTLEIVLNLLQKESLKKALLVQAIMNAFRVSFQVSRRYKTS